MTVPNSAGSKELTYDIADIKLAERGRFRMQWAAKEMPVLDLIEDACQGVLSHVHKEHLTR